MDEGVLTDFLDAARRLMTNRPELRGVNAILNQLGGQAVMFVPERIDPDDPVRSSAIDASMAAEMVAVTLMMLPGSGMTDAAKAKAADVAVGSLKAVYDRLPQWIQKLLTMLGEYLKLFVLLVS